MKRMFALGVAFLLLAGFSTLIVAEANGQCCGTTGWGSSAVNCPPAYCNTTYTARPVFAGRLRGRFMARNNAYCYTTPTYATVTPAPTYVSAPACGGCVSGCVSCCQPAPVMSSACCGTAGCYDNCGVARARIFPLRNRAMYTSTCCPTNCATNCGTAWGTSGCASGCGTVITGDAPIHSAPETVIQPPTEATPPSPDDT